MCLSAPPVRRALARSAAPSPARAARLRRRRHGSPFGRRGPEAISAAVSHSCKAVTGQVSGELPRGIVISAPSPSASVLERSISSFMPPRVQVTCSTSRATSSERRRAPAKPTRNSARSRAPARLVPHARLSLLTSAVVNAAARRASAPCFRAIPRRVSRIAGWLVSSGYPATPQARAIAATRRRSVGAA